MENALIDGRSVWTAKDLADVSVWSVKLSKRVAREAGALVAKLDSAGKTLSDVNPEDFSGLAYADLAAEIRSELVGGRGIVLLRDVPVTHMSLQGAGMFFWGLGSLLGTPLPQNLRGDRLYAIEDEGIRDGLVLSSKTNVALPWHTDSGSGAFANAVPDLFGLLMIRSAREGGTSHILSAHAVYNRMLRRYPNQLARLFQDFYFDRSLQAQPGQEPFIRTAIFEHVDGVIGIRYNRQRINRGYQLAQIKLGEEEEAALDCLDEVLDDSELTLSFDMVPGDALFTNNRITLHNRSNFINGDSPDKRRLLYRLWIQKTR